MQKTGLQGVIGPIHDRDLNQKGELKKAHYHVLITYRGPQTYNSVKALTDSLNASRPEPVESLRGAFRYLTHRDNPEKAQYDESDIQLLNGFNISDIEELTKSEINEIKRNIRIIIRHYDFTDYCQLLDYLDYKEMYREAIVAGDHTILFDAYLRSRRNHYQELKKTVISNGEVKE